MNQSRFEILIPFSKSVVLSKIACLLFMTISNSHLSISITLCCASTIICTYVDCCTSTCTSVDGYTSASTMFSSLASICEVCVSTKCCSTSLSSSNSSMNIGSINVVSGFVCSLTQQLFSVFVQEQNYRSSNSIYIVNYHLHKLHLLIVCFSFYTF